MTQKLRLTATQILNNPSSRAIFILGTVALAVLAGAAPHNGGG